MIRALLVEDEPASRQRLRDLAGEFAEVEIVGECADGPSAVDAITRLRPDLVLLDIQLPGLDGMAVLDAIPEAQRPAVLFLTAYDDFAIQAFDANAVDYVLKPFSTARFTRALNRALERLKGARLSSSGITDASSNTPAGFVPIARFAARSINKTYFIRAADVDWIDMADNYLRLHVGGRTHLVRGTLSNVIERLDQAQFLRINRGLVVRIDAIASIESSAPATYRVTLKDGARLSSSRTYAADIRKLMSE